MEGPATNVSDATVNCFALVCFGPQHILPSVDKDYPAHADLEQGFEQITHTGNWRQLANMPGVVPAFNVFQVLDDAVCENSWSRILAALFTSSGNHGLGMRPVRTWLALAADSRFKALAKQAVDALSLCEWVTREGRRLDILIKLLDRHGDLIGVVGVENKVGSGEQHEQLSDYQDALCEDFPGAPKILLFLTPNAGKPQTAVDNSSCECRSCSYKTVLTMCDSLSSSASKEMRFLLSSLHDFIDQNILTDSLMNHEIKQRVRKLYQNRDHRSLLETIFENRPTLEDVRSYVNKAAADYFAKTGVKCSFSQWPNRTANPAELWIMPEPLEKSDFGIIYMFRSRARHPFIGDSLTILVTAWSKGEDARKRVKNLNAVLPKRISHDVRNWSEWEVLWEGETYALQDLNGCDAKNLAQLLTKAVSQTFEPLKLAVAKV